LKRGFRGRDSEIDFVDLDGFALANTGFSKKVPPPPFTLIFQQSHW
jgi:hypothetical protein